MEDVRLSFEVAITWFFNRARWLVRSAFLLPRVHPRKTPSEVSKNFGAPTTETSNYLSLFVSLLQFWIREHFQPFSVSNSYSVLQSLNLSSVNEPQSTVHPS